MSIVGVTSLRLYPPGKACGHEDIPGSSEAEMFYAWPELAKL